MGDVEAQSCATAALIRGITSTGHAALGLMDLGCVLCESHATPALAYQHPASASCADPRGGNKTEYSKGAAEQDEVNMDAPPYSVPAKGKPPWWQAARHFFVVNVEPSTFTGHDRARPLADSSVKQPSGL